MRTWSKVAVVAALIGVPLAACGLPGGGTGQTDCLVDVAGPDAWNTGAQASYERPVVSCSHDDTYDQDQYLYPETSSDFTVTCTLEVGEEEAKTVNLRVYQDPGTGASGNHLGEVYCTDAGADVSADLDPGDHLLIEVEHFTAGTRARVTVA